MQKYFPVLLVFLFLSSCESTETTRAPDFEPRQISVDLTTSLTTAQKLRAESSAEVADGLELSLWATDSLITDPIALSVAPDGRVFYTSGSRQRTSEFDIRGHRDWMVASLSFKTVEDRRAFLRKTFSEDSEQSTKHLKDLNEDGVLDWRDLAVEREQIWSVKDRNGDGVGDQAQLYLEDFGEEITDVANGLVVRDNEVFLSVGPDLWRTTDEDRDGVADATESISHGYAIHVGFSGHGMSGVTVGPQGRIWWGIGDIGMNSVDQEGKRHDYNDRGVIVRSEPDGSNFEVFCSGVRNTHEFAFDEYGNLISVDNDGDHARERERLVYLIDGSDTGWRINWQFGKYSDPKNNGYKVWMDEGYYLPRWDGQAAHILPNITQFVNGPTGLVYNPGTALGPEYYNHFFVAEFVGTPTNSPLHAFTLKPDGAGFALDSSRILVRGLLPTGMDFGAEGSLYFGDWINGWGVKDAGRIWKLDVEVDDREAAIRKEVQQLLTSNFGDKSTEELSTLLTHQDQRVRREAQFALVERPEEGLRVFQQTLSNTTGNQLSRVHACWGIGQLARADRQLAGKLLPYLEDADSEIIAQAARMLGDVRYAEAGRALLTTANHPEPRVKMLSIEALGRIAHAPALPAIQQIVADSDGEDPWLLHAAMVALGRIGDAEAIADWFDHPSEIVRTAAVVGLRRMENPEVARFLRDESEYVATQAARAINDDGSIEAALPALAAALENKAFVGAPLLRRAINANYRLGDRASVNRLVGFAADVSRSDTLRAEALAALTQWGTPSVFDRVDGVYRKMERRDSSFVGETLSPVLVDLIAGRDPLTAMAGIRAAGRYQLDGNRSVLAENLRRHPSAEVRAATLTALAAIKGDGFEENLVLALKDRGATVRARALELLPDSGLEEARTIELYEGILRGGSIDERRSAVNGLASIGGAKVERILGKMIHEITDRSLAPALQLDVFEAVQGMSSAALSDPLTAAGASFDDDPLGTYRLALEGGDRDRGQSIFYGNQSAQCVRCHVIWEYGGNVGPVLEGIGSLLTREEILTSLVLPSARHAPGYETVLVTKSDSSMLSGVVIERSADWLKLRVGKDAIEEIPVAEVAEVETLPSSMPSMKERLSKGEIRDLVAFLASIRGHAG